MSEGPKKVLIIGLGRIGVYWKGVVEEQPEKIEIVGTVDPVNPAADYKEIDDQILGMCDGVLVCSPTSTHPEYVIKCLQADKFVLCEKPLCSEDEDIKRCFAEVKKDHQLLVGLNRRWDEKVCSLRGTDPQTVSIDCRDFPEPPDSFLKHSGGVYIDCLIHEFDILSFALGFGGNDCRVKLVDQHVQDNESKQLEKQIEFIKSSTVVLGTDSGKSAIVRFCRRFADRYVHTIALDNGTKLDPLLPQGSSFADRYSDAFRNLLNTFIRIMHGTANKEDVGRIPDAAQCLHLNRLCRECVAN